MTKRSSGAVFIADAACPQGGTKPKQPRHAEARLVLAALVTIAVLSVAGCGGNDDDAPSKQEFIAQADAICQEAYKRGAKTMYGPNFSDAAFLSRHNALTRVALERLRALDAPEGDREAVDDVLSALEASVAAVDKRTAALRARDRPRQSEAQQDFERSYGDVAASAGALGLSRCQALGA